MRQTRYPQGFHDLYTKNRKPGFFSKIVYYSAIVAISASALLGSVKKFAEQYGLTSQANVIHVEEQQAPGSLEDRLQTPKRFLDEEDYMVVKAWPGMGWYDFMRLSGLPKDRWVASLGSYRDDVDKLTSKILGEPAFYDPGGNPVGELEYAIPIKKGSN